MANGNCIIIAADGMRARMFVVQQDASLQAGSRLIEKIHLVNTELRARGTDAPQVRSERNTSRQAGPMHPQDAERDWHRAELERRFAREIAAHAASLVKTGAATRLVLAATPRMLGHVRAPLRKALGPRMKVAEIGRDYTHLTPARLHGRLAAADVL
jgi:protein required for attachment to host cells